MQAFFLCSFTTTTGSDNFRKPEFFPRQTWVFSCWSWVIFLSDLSFFSEQTWVYSKWSNRGFQWVFMNFCIKISCSTYVLAHFSGCPWYLSFFLLTLPALSELGNSENLSFLPKKAPEFFQNLSFFWDLSFQSAQKKSLIYRIVTVIWTHNTQGIQRWQNKFLKAQSNDSLLFSTTMEVNKNQSLLQALRNLCRHLWSRSLLWETFQICYTVHKL